MLRADVNERLTRVGPETPMGELFRRYWLPAVLAEELAEPDSPPVRVEILGEHLVAFRDSSGQVGLVDAHCPHRLAPMFFGRNEECGLRCVYHGWKFDAAGNCVDMPSEPPDSQFKSKVNIKAYPTWERGGVVWTYMGPRSEVPPPPDYEWLRAPATHQRVSKTLEHANYLQAVEGGIDTAHSSFVHNNDLGNAERMKSMDLHPELQVDRTPYGFNYAGIRTIDGGRKYVRAYHFILPAQQMRAALLLQNGKPRDVPTLRGHFWVPINDEWTAVYNILSAADESKGISDDMWAKHEKAAGRGADDFIPGSYRLRRNLDNDYWIDREMQRVRTYTGITGLNTQDYAVQEGMGPICDRPREHLGSTDKAVITARRLLQEAIDNLGSGTPPPGWDPESYRYVRPAEAIIDGSLDWREAMKDLLTAGW